MLYPLIILIGMIVISIVNIIFNVFSLEIWYIIVAVVTCTVGAFCIDGVFAFLIRRLPEKKFAVDGMRLDATKKERQLLEKLGVRKWKDKVIELGCFTNFHKDKISDPNSIEYVSRFILESNYGIVIHICDMFVGFLVIFFFPLKYALCFGLPVAIVNAFLHFLPMCILRYNLPRLRTLYKLNLRKQTPVDNASVQQLAEVASTDSNTK